MVHSKKPLVGRQQSVFQIELKVCNGIKSYFLPSCIPFFVLRFVRRYEIVSQLQSSPSKLISQFPGCWKATSWGNTDNSIAYLPYMEMTIHKNVQLFQYQWVMVQFKHEVQPTHFFKGVNTNEKDFSLWITTILPFLFRISTPWRLILFPGIIFSLMHHIGDVADSCSHPATSSLLVLF